MLVFGLSPALNFSVVSILTFVVPRVSTQGRSFRGNLEELQSKERFSSICTSRLQEPQATEVTSNATKEATRNASNEKYTMMM